MKLKNILIVVDDVERSKNFYCHLFGLRVVTDFGGNVILTEGLVLQERKMWDGLIGESSISGGNDVELYFEENNMDAFFKEAGRVAGTGKISSCACGKCVGETGCQNRRPGRAYDRNR